MREPKIWIKKYLIADSFVRRFFLSVIRGIKDNKLISNPIHIPSHEEDEIVIKVPVNIVTIKINFEIKLIIKKKRGKTFIFGVWAQKLF